MLKLSLYIRSVGGSEPGTLLREPVEKRISPDPPLAGIISPMQLRRMSKAVRMAVWAAHQCMEVAAIEVPDAIIAGTGLGCLQDTESFLSKMISQEEEMLTPTSFIQSTHNTAAGQIALLRGCTGYNLTVSQQGHSFEGALMAAQLYLTEHPEHTVLTGGVDELTDTSFTLLQQAGAYLKKGTIAPAEELTAQSAGVVAGEGAAFFLLSANPLGTSRMISGLQLFSHERELLNALHSLRAISRFMLGENGDMQDLKIYTAIREAFTGTPCSVFKNRCGDYPTAASYALTETINSPDERIVIVNSWCGSWSIIVADAVTSQE